MWKCPVILGPGLWLPRLHEASFTGVPHVCLAPPPPNNQTHFGKWSLKYHNLSNSDSQCSSKQCNVIGLPAHNHSWKKVTEGYTLRVPSGRRLQGLISSKPLPAICKIFSHQLYTDLKNDQIWSLRGWFQPTGCEIGTLMSLWTQSAKIYL